MKVWRLLMWFLLWVFYSFFSLPRMFCSVLVAALEKLSINVKTIWILFLLPSIFRTALLFSLVRSLLVKKGRFYGSICWKFTRIYIYSLNVVQTKLFRWLCWNAKVHKITIFMTRHIVWLLHETFESILKLLRFVLGV